MLYGLSGGLGCARTLVCQAVLSVLFVNECSVQFQCTLHLSPCPGFGVLLMHVKVMQVSIEHANAGCCFDDAVYRAAHIWCAHARLTCCLICCVAQVKKQAVALLGAALMKKY
jgi:hypothetical protein